MRRALILAFMCLREEANARTTISQVVDALDVLVEFMARKEKKKEHSIWTRSRRRRRRIIEKELLLRLLNRLRV
ncbi:hypothetical protein Bca4012_067184 [Brassica carinata]